MTGERGVVLLVEDDPDDVFFLQEAFTRAGLAAALRVARDGEEAIAYLTGAGGFADRARYPLPALVLLDLKLPRKSGLEVLEWRVGDAHARRIPVVVLTSSRNGADIERAYDLGANSYLVKPVNSEAQLAMVRVLREYWILLNILPPS